MWDKTTTLFCSSILFKCHKVVILFEIAAICSRNQLYVDTIHLRMCLFWGC